MLVQINLIHVYAEYDAAMLALSQHILLEFFFLPAPPSYHQSTADC